MISFKQFLETRMNYTQPGTYDVWKGYNQHIFEELSNKNLLEIFYRQGVLYVFPTIYKIVQENIHVSDINYELPDATFINNCLEAVQEWLNTNQKPNADLIMRNRREIREAISSQGYEGYDFLPLFYLVRAIAYSDDGLRGFNAFIQNIREIGYLLNFNEYIVDILILTTLDSVDDLRLSTDDKNILNDFLENPTRENTFEVLAILLDKHQIEDLFRQVDDMYYFGRIWVGHDNLDINQLVEFFNSGRHLRQLQNFVRNLLNKS